MRRQFALAGLLLLAASVQPQMDPASLPARDAHEGLLIAADPYADAAQYKVRFGKKNPYNAGILAVEVYFRNDTDKPIRVDLETIRLLLNPPGSERQKLGAMSAEEVADRVLYHEGSDPSSQRRIPVPGRTVKKHHGKDWEELVATLRASALSTDLVAPHSPAHGILFFDIDHRFEWLAYARLYVPDLRFMTDKKALLYFELDLAAPKPR